MIGEVSSNNMLNNYMELIFKACNIGNHNNTIKFNNNTIHNLHTVRRRPASLVFILINF